MMQQENFSYSAAPHAAPVSARTQQRAKYRDENLADPSQNIMYDSRVVRGNTYSNKVLPTATIRRDTDGNGSNKRLMPRKPYNNSSSSRNNNNNRSGTPPPVDGRAHSVMQTEDFLEELNDRPIEQDAETQTNLLLDRPPSPLFVRAKIGFDVQTQIEVGDLFDFDVEVQPILEVLVGKTLHVSMLEIMQEEELEAIRGQQEEFECIRNVELAELQRLETEIKRKAIEKERRISQEKERLRLRRQVEEHIAARQFSTQFLGDLHTDVFDMLQAEGHFFDPVEREIEELFIPMLTAGTSVGVNCFAAASAMARELLSNARAHAIQYGEQCVAVRRAEEERERVLRAQAEEERLRAEAERLKAEEEKRLREEAEGEQGGAE